MCYLLTVGISGGSGDPAQIFRANGLHVAPAANGHVRAAMSKSQFILDVTDGQCSCSLRALPSADPAQEDEVERARYAQKGWSETKIKRAMAGKARARHKQTSKARSLCLSIEALVHAGSKVALVSHCYNGDFAHEAVSVGARASMPLNEFMDRLGAFPDDTLVTIE